MCVEVRAQTCLDEDDGFGSRLVCRYKTEGSCLARREHKVAVGVLDVCVVDRMGGWGFKAE